MRSILCFSHFRDLHLQAAGAQVRVLLLHVLPALLAGRVHGMCVAAAGVWAASLRSHVPWVLPLQWSVGGIL